MTPTITVFGASGKVGAPLSRRLAERGVAVRAFYDPTKPQRAAFPAEVTELHGSFDDRAAVRRAVAGADAVFLLTPPSGEQTRWQRALIDEARNARVARAVKLSAFESDPRSPLQMGRWHYDGELALLEAGLEHVILRPQYFMQNLTAPLREAAQTGVWRGAAHPDTRVGLVDVEDVAAVAAAVLTERGHEGEILSPTGPTAKSFEEMANELAGVLERPVRYEQRPREEVSAELAARGWPDWYISDFFKINGEAASPVVTSVVSETTGREPTGFACFLRRLLREPARG